MRKFEHVWKNLYIVHSTDDMKAAARFHVRNNEAQFTCRYNVDGKFPMIVAVEGTNEMVHIAIPLTENTLTYCLHKLAPHLRQMQ